mmetsp:Transcript_1502/g.3419  ORF Transcript_1502/g.3419 Transcript_1502/m.3419 type:complete len:226 (-) Transcript_1502:1784-2461(-)
MLFCHRVHRAEDRRGNLLDVEEQTLERKNDDRGHHIGEKDRGTDDEEHDGGHEHASACRIEPARLCDVEHHLRASHLDLHLVLLSPRGAPCDRELLPGTSAIAISVADLIGKVRLRAVEVLEVCERDPSASREEARRVGHRLCPHFHGEVVLGVGGQVEEGQYHDHDDDQARDASRQRHIEHARENLDRANLTLLLHARQVLQQLHQLREAAGPGAQLRHARSTH